MKSNPSRTLFRTLFATGLIAASLCSCCPKHNTLTQAEIADGWQCEVAPKNHDTAGIYESYGRGWLVQIPDEKESILKEGDWNTLRLKVQGDRVQTWLNGEEMVDITDAKIGAAQGRIALQIHDGGGIKVLWRNIRLTTL